MVVVATVASGLYPGYCATIFNPATTASVLFNTYNTARSEIAYPLSFVNPFTFAGTLAMLTLSYPIKVALLPNILMFLS